MVRYGNKKTEAVLLRKQGLSYSEILTRIPVAKSTLSLWLREVKLAKRTVQKLTEKKRAGALRGALARKNERITQSQKIFREAELDVKKITNREFWLIGIALYWAEGSKQKEHNISERLKFSNSDPMMLVVFLKWLKDFLKIRNDQIRIDLYIHESIRSVQNEHCKYWQKLLDMNVSGVYYKNNKIRTLRKNTGDSYHGLISISIKRSTNLNRKVRGWINGIVMNYLV